MKKVFLTVALSLSIAGFAQIIDVRSVTEIKVPAEISGFTVISPQGDYLLVTDHGKKGLHKYDLESGKLTTLTNAPGAGYDVKILDDGETIIYRETSYTRQNLKKTTLKSMNIRSGSTSVLVKATRDLEGVTLRNGTVYSVKEGRLSQKSLTPSPLRQTEPPVLSISNGQLMITRDGNTSTFSPNGTQVRYIWPSLSPDGTKVLYYVIGRGSYVCNLDGSNVHSLGMLRAPKWYNDSVVIGMYDISGEYDTVESKIIAVTVDGKQRQEVTADSIIAMYPSPTRDGSKIAFSTPDGKTYLIQVNIQR